MSIDILLGSNLTLECIGQNNVDAPNELEFYWYHNGRSITTGSRITIKSTGENATRVASSELVVMQVTDGDSGEYQCTVTNWDVVDGINATSNITVLCKWPNHTVITHHVAKWRSTFKPLCLLFSLSGYSSSSVPFWRSSKKCNHYPAS